MPSLNWAQWVLIGLCACSAIWAGATVGQPRKPRSAAEAAAGVVINVGFIWLIIILAGGGS